MSRDDLEPRRHSGKRAHIVLAHPEPHSFNAHLARVSRRRLRSGGWEVSVSDLYAMGFDPREEAGHYECLRDPARLDVMAQQRFASERGAIPDEIAAEIERLDRADLVVFQYPVWWHLPPAILKGWMDRVLVYGEVYSSRRRFESGRFAGKRALLSVTVATTRDTYAHNGRSADIHLLLWPVQFTLAYVGFDVVEPFVAYDVRPGVERLESLQAAEEELLARLRRVRSDPLVPFHRTSDWDDRGRIRPDAPVFSPFIRHRKSLDLG